MANPVGRPRTVSPLKDECETIGIELIEWALNPKSTRFPQFYSLKKNMLRDTWKALIKTPQFRPYYEKAQVFLADRCIDGTMEKSFGQRYIRLYDRDLTEEENETAKYNADLKKTTDKENMTQTLSDFTQFIEQKKHSDGK